MDKLPTELVSHIIELAIADDRDTARQLCLVNQRLQDIVLPLLYRHVHLSNLKQIKSFNKIVASSPRLCKLICGITLSDKDLPELVEDDVNGYLQSAEYTGWIQHWKKLIQNLGTLNRQHSLKTLVITEEGSQYLEFFDTSDDYTEYLAEALTESKLQLDHLVVSHAVVGFFLKPKRWR